jgi:uncharacterized Fe-S cluster-containing radical SAM superfamily protein
MSPSRYIPTDLVSARYRDKSIDVAERRLLISRLAGSEQERDFTVPSNCSGLGRIRHFRRETRPGWPSNPLPIEPAAKALKLPEADLMRAQVFQNAACNWRCWYCYVPFNLLSADEGHAQWVTPGELIDLYLAEEDPPPLLDLTGGQPDLVPEWVPWTMREIRRRGLEERVYLWSDDNLSTDYLWQYLANDDLDLMSGYRNYGRVGCFKGLDKASFSFNTGANPDLFDRQFQLMSRLLRFGLDVYAYATFTTPNRDPVHIETSMRRFVDRLQELDPNLPLRTVPLEIREFSPVRSRIHEPQEVALEAQALAIASWHAELGSRYSAGELGLNVAEVPLQLYS